jgi:hypothetical protein
MTIAVNGGLALAAELHNGAHGESEQSRSDEEVGIVPSDVQPAPVGYQDGDVKVNAGVSGKGYAGAL